MFARKNADRRQLLEEHLRNVAATCKESCSVAGMGNIGYALGLAHDVGKSRPEWQEYLEHGGKEVHSVFAALMMINANLPPYIEPHALSICSGHHTGLKEITPEKLLEIANFNTPFSVENVKREGFSSNTGRGQIAVLLIIQYLFSCLVDADRLDARAYDGHVPRKFLSMSQINDRYLQYLEKVKARPGVSDSVRKIRQHVFSDCESAASQEGSFFSLTAPTGSGKTLASFNFAIQRAIATNKKRIIYVLPYQSIVKQTFGDMIEFLGTDNVLEYHAAENNYVRHIPWEEPIVVTTHHQFFESFFSCNAARSRKLRYIAESVIIFDELQTFKPELFSLLEVLMEFAGKMLQSDVLVMSATLPKWTRGFHPKEISTKTHEIYADAKRVNIFRVSWSDDELRDRFMASNSALYVVNTRQRARDFWNLCNDPEVYCLTTLVHQKRREEIIDEIKDKLRKGETCRIVATTLIDVGVDIDVGVVFRDLSDFGAMLQSFGRCNRHGLRPAEDVFIVNPTGPGLETQEKQTTKYFLVQCEAGKMSVESLQTIQNYYEILLKKTNSSVIACGKINQIADLFSQQAYDEIARICRLIDEDANDSTLFAAGEDEKYAEFLEQASRNCLNYRELQKYIVRVPQKFIQGLDINDNSAITSTEDEGRQILPPRIPREQYDQYGLLI